MTQDVLTAREKQEVEQPSQTRPGRYYLPDVDIREDEQALWLWADMPGVRQEHITVDLDHDTLTIRGDVDLADYDGLTPMYTEYNVGGFVRQFALAAGSRFDVDGISARVSNGVLVVQIPKTERARQRRIPVTES